MSNELHLTVGALDDHERRIANIEERLDALESRRRPVWRWPVAAGVLGMIIGACSAVPSRSRVEHMERRFFHARDACLAMAEKYDDRQHGCP